MGGSTRVIQLQLTASHEGQQVKVIIVRGIVFLFQ